MEPEEIVRAEMVAWGRNDVDEVMSHFAEDATLHAGPYAPVLGHNAIRKTVEGYFSRGTCVDHEILFIATVGDVVLMERIDHWIINGKTLAIPHMGICEVKDQKITAWREYFIPSGDS
jgi:limonene-1,2-epoxide hydrolase